MTPEFVDRVNYVAVDGLRSSLEECKRNVVGAKLFILGGLVEIKNLANDVDSIILLDVLEHFEDDDKFLLEISTILKVGGFLFISVPAYQFLFSPADERSGHFRRYNEADLAKQFEAEGFEPVFRSSFILLSLPALVLSRLVSRLGKKI